MLHKKIGVPPRPSWLPRQLHPRTKWLILVLFSIHFLMAVGWQAVIWPLGFDARSYFAAAHAILQDQLPVSIDRPELLGWASANDTPPYLYPPLLALLLTPFTLVPLGVAHALWFTIVVATTLCLVPLLRPFIGWHIATVGVLCFVPTWYSGWMGQINALIAVLYTLALLAARREAWARGAAWLMLGALIKIVPVLSLLVLVAHRKWRGVVVAGVVGALIVALTLPFVGVEAWYHGLLAANSVSWRLRSSFSWVGQANYWLGHGEDAAGYALTTLFLVATLLRLPKIPPTLGLAATMILPLLIAPITWQHHALMVLPALAVLWQWSARGRMLAASTWLLLTLVNDVAMPVMLTLCWIACCWPHLLHDPQPATDRAHPNAMQPLPPQHML